MVKKETFINCLELLISIRGIVILMSGENKVENKVIDDKVIDDVVYISPVKQQVAELKRQFPEIKHRNTLAVFSDILDINSKRDGYVVARSDAFSIRGEPIDLAVAHMYSKTNIPDFYNIPVLHTESNDAEELFSMAFDHLCVTGYNRCMINSEKSTDLLMVDTFLGKKLEQQFTFYLVADLADISVTEGVEGRALKERVDEILRELCVRH